MGSTREAPGRKPAGQRTHGRQDGDGADERQGIAGFEAVEEWREQVRGPQACGGADRHAGTSPATRPGAAPRAMRMPISVRRRFTAYGVTP
jgi:hypothetical protein